MACRRPLCISVSDSQNPSHPSSGPSFPHTLQGYPEVMGDGAPKPLCVAVIGPVSGGKSTLCGRIIAEFNGIEAKQLVAYRQAAREAGL
eukprot:66331-Amorphochlora_amoeboformis.AAC.1